MAQKYFSGLNYTLGNEDTSVEIELMKIYEPRSIFSVCGSGGRSLPLSGPAVADLTMCDLSKEQISLAKLREATYRQLTYEEFLTFWGYFPYSDDDNCDIRKELFTRLELSEDVLSMFKNIFEEINFSSILYSGKWERTFGTFAKINRALMGRHYDEILKFDNLLDQKEYYKKSFPHLRWKLVLFLLGNKALFNALLYKGDFIEKNSPLSHFEYYQKAFERLFTEDIAKKSFFLHLCFYGKIKSIEGVPIEAKMETHQRIQNSKTQINYITHDLVSYLKSGIKKYDLLSLSDVPSYFKGDLERDFMQMIRPSLRPGAIVVNRYYLRISDCNLDGFTDITNNYSELIKAEKVQMYNICIYRYDP